MRFQQKLKLEHVALHREKAGPEDGDLGVAIKLTGGIKLQDAVELIACKHTVALLDHLYTAEGSLRTDNVSAVKLDVCHEDVAVTLRAGSDKKFKDGTLDNITLTPKLSRVLEVTARLKVHPTESQMGWLGMMMGSEAVVILEAKKAVIGGSKEQPPLPLPDKAEKKPDEKKPAKLN